MAEKETDEQQEAGSDGVGGGTLKIVLLVLAGLLMIGLSVGGTLYALGFFDSEEVQTAAPAPGSAAEMSAKVPAMYFPIKPAFVVDFQSRGRRRLLQVDVTLMTRDPAVYDAVQRHLPLIKNTLVMLFSGEDYETLQTDEGKELLRQSALDALQGIMQQEIGRTGVEQVLFTSFVMQ